MIAFMNAVYDGGFNSSRRSNWSNGRIPKNIWNLWNPWNAREAMPYELRCNCHTASALGISLADFVACIDVAAVA